MTTGTAVYISWEDQYSKIPRLQYTEKTNTNIIKQFLPDALACLKNKHPSKLHVLYPLFSLFRVSFCKANFNLPSILIKSFVCLFLKSHNYR